MPRPYTLYIQMALCEHSLHQWLRRYWAQPTACPAHLDATDYREALRMCLEMTEGVNHLHSLNLIHRDLKPSNVFLQRRAGETQWRVAIGDFGLARALPVANPANDSDSGVPCSAVSMAITPATAAASCTMSSGVGTETYASPEQISGGVYDTKTDIYSLGLIFFEMLSSFATEMERLMQLRELKDGVLPADFIARYPREAAFILCMTAKKPQDRPTARSLLEGDGALFAVAAAKRDALEAEQQQRAEDLRILQEQIREQEARFALLNKMLQGYTMNSIDPNLLGEG
jgi:serine/threonine protein kinase